MVAESNTIKQFRDTLEEKNIEVEKAREEYISVKSYFDSLENKAKDRNTRLTQISLDLEAWNTRNHSAREQISDLEKRKLTLSSELTKLDSAPEQISEKGRIYYPNWRKQEGTEVKPLTLYLGQKNYYLKRMKMLRKVSQS